MDHKPILQGQQAHPLAEWLTQHDFEQQYCGLINVPHGRDLYALFYDASGTCGYHGVILQEDSTELCLSSILAGTPVVAYLSFNRDGYSSHCRDYKAYWQWVEKRNEQRYLTNVQSGNDFDAKNMMHTIRLLQVAHEIMTQGTITNKRPNREALLGIKNGALAYDEIMQLADKLLNEIETASTQSSLPDEPNSAEAIQTLINMRDALYSPLSISR